MPGSRINLLLLVTTLMALMLAAVEISHSKAAHKHRVLLISSYHPAFPTFFEQINGIKTVLREPDVKLDIEFMDSKRFFDEDNLNNFYTSLEHKLAQVSPYDAIIVSDDNALHFVVEHQAELFPETPIVFLGVNNVAFALEQNETPYITGVIERVSTRDTIDLMLSLPPHPTKIYAIVDDTPSGQGDIETFRAVTNEYPDATFSELSLTDLSFSEFTAELNQLETDSAVLLLSAYRDRTGEALDFDDSLQLIRSNSNVPLYHLWYHGMGSGILGGKLISHYEQGKTAALIAKQILGGTPVDTIPVIEESPNRYIFDFNEMTRFGMTEDNLPANSLIVNMPESLYQTYKTLIWSVLGVISVLLILIVLLSINILKRRQIERKLRASEQKYRTYVDSAPYGVFVTNIQGQTIDVNDTATQITGYSKNNLLQLDIDELMASFQNNGYRNLQSVTDSQPMSAELRLTRPDGAEYYMSIDAVKLPGDQVLAYWNDITTRKQAEEDLRQRNRQLNLINQIIAASAAEVETQALLGTVCRELAYAFDVPQAAAALINNDRISAQVVAEYRTNDRPSGLKHTIPVADNPTYAYLFQHKKPLIIANARTDLRLSIINELVNEREIGSLLIIPLIIEDEVIGSLGVDSLEPNHFSQSDITLAQSVASQVSGALARAKLMEERQKLEERYHHAQRMESLGRLTGGVAHDFNNLLTAINGFAEMIQSQLPPEHSTQPMLRNILNSGNRAADLVRQLLAFSRKQIIEPQILDLNTILTDLEKMLRRIIGENISLETRLQPGIWPIKMDPTQMEQVVLNLVVNSRDAMPDGGKLIIDTFNQTLVEHHMPPKLEIEPGDYVGLSIRDTGNGIADEILEHIFEPFFTTKEQGKGTGLGLATVYGIVKQNDGDIQIQSIPGMGAHFTIYLPRNKGFQNSANQSTSWKATPGGSETVLVVEDDSLVRTFLCRVLKMQGYNLLEATTGEEALQVAEERSGIIDLLVTDVIMPGMNGKLLSEKFSKIYPNSPVLFTSGYTDEYISTHGVLEPGFHFLQKPVSPGLLAQKVRELLDSTASKRAEERSLSVE
jgi:PAS domain S-box-containing protein